MESTSSENEKEQLMGKYLNSKCKISTLPTLKWHVHTYANEPWNLVLKLCSGGKINSYNAGTWLVSTWRQACDSSLQSQVLRRQGRNITNSRLPGQLSEAQPPRESEAKVGDAPQELSTCLAYGRPRSSALGRKRSKCKKRGISGGSGLQRIKYSLTEEF